MFAYCNNNPVNHFDPSGQTLIPISVGKFFVKLFSALVRNVQSRAHMTTPSIMVDGGPLVGEVGFSSTVTYGGNSEEVLYSFTDVGNDETRNGIGVNFGGWLGGELGFSNNGNLFADIQITPYTQY